MRPAERARRELIEEGKRTTPIPGPRAGGKGAPRAKKKLLPCGRSLMEDG